jgi:hypothetical protein
MPIVFVIQAIRLQSYDESPEIVDWIISRARSLADAKRHARDLSENASAAEWTGPAAEFIRIMDGSGIERFRCRCRVALKSRKAQGSSQPATYPNAITSSLA